MFNKLPSIKILLKNLWLASKRFPLAIIVAIIATVMAIVLIHHHDSLLATELLMIATMAFPLFVSVVMFTEEREWGNKVKYVLNGIVILFLTLYYFFLLPENIMIAQESFMMCYAIWLIAFCLLVFCSRFIRKQENIINAFWQFNKILFFSLVLTAFYVGAIQAGLSIALSSINYLFELDIDGKRYMEIWIVLTGIFGHLFFLSRFPKKYSDYAEEINYPKELKLFVQFIMVPLVSLYFLILYAYVIKILVLWEWPKGVLAYMILGFSLLGVLTYFILYPLREKYNWVKTIGQIYCIILLPQIGMLFWSLWWRVSQYGITEKRYLVFIFGCWLLVLALYLLISKKKDIRFIPISLVIIAILISFGPWGAFAVSKNNQMKRLERTLCQNEILINGQLQELGDKNYVSFVDRKEISAIVLYLYENHGIEPIEKVLNEDLSLIENKELKDVKRYRSTNKIVRRIVVEIIKLDYVDRWERTDSANNRFNFYTNTMFSENPVLEIHNYDYLYHASARDVNDIGDIKGNKFSYELNDEMIFNITRNNEIVAQYDLTKLIDNLIKEYSSYPNFNLDRDVLSFSSESGYLSYTFYITNLSGKIENDNKYQVQDIRGWLLFSIK
ncbi:DUF4153 domain-containing protein [Candidatus Parcubacteria bacterium]|nr:DUF4153 domain-containing protein [Candidatus Parcubacteria bacterium]